MDEGDAITERTSVTEAITLKAALRTSCEHPGFTMVRTWEEKTNSISEFTDEENCKQKIKDIHFNHKILISKSAN